MEKTYVRSLFDSIAQRYDLLNHLLSGGADFHWRKRAIAHLEDLRPKQIIDVACGTADFSIAALTLDPKHVTGVDLSENMLKLAREKIARKGLQSKISVQMGEAEHLDFPTGSFDAAIVAFGVRNFENLEKGISEMHRVLMQHGRIVVLEFSKPDRFPFRQIYFSYFKHLLPLLGKKVSGHPNAYTYLRDTVMAFPEGREFCERLERAGFRDIRAERMTFGIATAYSGTK